MAIVPRVLEQVLETQGESPRLILRTERIEALVGRAENLIKMAAQAQAKGDEGNSRNLKKSAHSEARMAMRLLGILMIEFGIDAKGYVERLRKVISEISLKSKEPVA